jgi:hypothetical protein
MVTTLAIRVEVRVEGAEQALVELLSETAGRLGRAGGSVEVEDRN